MAPDELDVLLIEDNPGDARLIEEMLRGAEGLLHRIDLAGSTPESSTIHHERTLSAGLDRLSGTDVDVVLLDLGLPDSTGEQTLVSVIEETEFTPVVVLTGLDDRDLGVLAIQSGAQDYLVKDDVNGELLVHSIQYAIERSQRERERVRHREQLEALDRLNGIIQDITHDVITMSTREDLERAVCERLVRSDAYRFAWIGEVNRPTDQLSPRVTAGVEEGYLDDVTVPVGDGAPVEGPAAKAVRTREVQVVRDARTDPSFEPWRAAARERGYRSIAAIPIAHGDFLYGVLGVYATSPDAFSGPEAEVLSGVGDVVGHAITAIERRDALVSDTVLELEFRVEGVAGELVALSAGEGTLAFEKFVRSDDTLLAYGRTDGIPREELQDVAERSDVVDDLRILSSGDEEYEFELVTGIASALVASVATHGGHVTSATIDGEEFRFVVEFPPGSDRRQLVELVEEHCAGATARAQRTVQRRGGDVPDFPSVFQTRLTEKQQTALETAFFAGYFDWPRTSTGQEIADRLGVTPATFTQHLRAAEREFFDAVFEDGTGGERRSPSSWTSLESGAGDD